MSILEGDGQDSTPLWRWFSEARRKPEQHAEPDALLLATYLDGTATRAEVDQVERAMCGDPSLQDGVAELRELRAAGSVDVPAALISRIKMALAATDGDGSVRAGSAARYRRWLCWWERAAAAAAIVAISFLGFQLGQGTTRTNRKTDAELATAIAVDLQQDGAEPDLLTLLDTSYGNGGDSQ